MKLLLTMNLPFTRAHGGANRSNRFLVRSLASRGHQVHAIVPALASPSRITREELLEDLQASGVEVSSVEGADLFELDGVEVHAVTEASRLRPYLTEQIARLEPDWVLASSEDPSQSLLDAALKVCPSRVIYLAHTPQMLPFGPLSLYPGEERTDLLGRATGIVTISRFVADYISRWSGFDAFTNHPPHYGDGPWPRLGKYDNPYVLMMNASAIKGLPIFVELARRRPDIQFAALPGYATTDDDRRVMDQLPNVTLLENREDLKDILRLARVLLMPTLWAEGFGMAVVDAMLHGIPVLASNYGGLTEAMLGLDYLLPVQPIRDFDRQLGENLLPVPVVPEQRVEPWLEALDEVLASPECYDERSLSVWQTAQSFVDGLGVEPLEQYLLALANGSTNGGRPSHEAPSIVTGPLSGNGGRPPLENEPPLTVRSDEAFEAGRAAAELTPEQRALLILKLRSRHRAETEPTVSAASAGDAKLSFAQQRLWFLAQLEPESPAYNMSSTATLAGQLDVAAVRRCLAEIERRHEVLRTTFEVVDGKPTPRTRPEPGAVVPVCDLGGISEEARRLETLRLARQHALAPFDLEQGPMLRAVLIRLRPDAHTVLFSMHHIAGDGWSMNVLEHELATLYEAFTQGRPSPLPELPLQYQEYANEQQARLDGPALQAEIDYWRQQLAEEEVGPGLPTDRLREGAPSHRGGSVTLKVDRAAAESLEELGKSLGATPFMVYLAAVAALLHRYSGERRVALGSPIAGRDQRKLEGLIGCFVNTVVFRPDLSGEPSFRELLSRTREVALQAFAHQEVPFEKVVEAVQPSRGQGGNPLFQVLYTYQDARRGDRDSLHRHFSIEGERVGLGKAVLDLTVNLVVIDDGLAATLAFDRDLFDLETVTAMGDQLCALIAAAAENPERAISEVALPDTTDRHRRLLAWSRSGGHKAATQPAEEDAPVASRAEVVAAREAKVAERRDKLSAAKRALLARRWRSRQRDAAPQIPRRTDSSPPLLSFAQQRLWFLWQLDPGSQAYNIPSALKLRGPLDVVALERALSEIVRRHEVLRTRFDQIDGRDVQVITPQISFQLPQVDLRRLSAADRNAELERQAVVEATRSFDLRRGPLFRAVLLPLAQHRHAAFVTMHHIVSDGWSGGVLVRELGALYEAFRSGQRSPLSPLAIQYADFAVWQRQQLSDEALEAQLEYWRQQLGGDLPILAMPTDRPRPAVQTFHGSMKSLAIPSAANRALQALAQREEATQFMVLLAAFGVLLKGYTGQDDVLVGNPTANRRYAEVEDLIGFFVNTRVLRSDLSGDPTFLELLRRVREVSLAADSHQDVPFERLVEELQPERDASRSPLFQVMLVQQTAPRRRPMAETGLTMEAMEVEGGAAQFDLILIFAESEGEATAHLKFNTDLFDATTASRLLDHFRGLLVGIANDPEPAISQLPLMSPGQRHQLTFEWSGAALERAVEGSVHQRFEEWVDRTPEAIALSSGDQQLSYAELDQAANRLARHLGNFGVGSGVAVGIFLDRSVEMVCSLLAVLKAGGAFIPFDPSYPLERLSLMIEDSNVAVLLTRDHLMDRLPTTWTLVIDLDADAELIAEESSARLGSTARGADLAYVMYTSGSTGRPKGVAVPHRAVTRLVCDTNFIALDPEHVFLQLAPTSFDASTLEIWGPLLNGSRLEVAPPEKPTLESLAEVLEQRRVTSLWLTAGLFHQMVDHQPESLRALRHLLAGGDVLSPPHVDRTLSQLERGELINGYGPTESTTFTACHCMRGSRRRSSSVPIGRPIANTFVRLLDEDQRQVPVGVFGELCIGGAGLARGYHQLPGRTATRFVPDPYAAEGGRLYRTGDLARFLGDGTLEFAGRNDHQVKIRGFRIEPGDVEAALKEHPEIKNAVVTAWDDGSGDKRLVAYFLSDDPPSVADTQAFLRERLPEYMVPSALVALEAFPLGPTGKVDRRALPDPREAMGRSTDSFVAPRTMVEEVLATIWAEVLGVERVGLGDSFFDLGGHSLMATQVVSRVRQSLGVELSLVKLFEAAHLEELAMLIEQQMRGEETPGLPPMSPADREQQIPLSFAQQRLWFIYQLAPESPLYNVPTPVRLVGGLELPSFAGAVNELVRRHEVLRTHFVEVEGEATQVVAGWQPKQIPHIDLSSLDEEQRENEGRRIAAEDAKRPFDLSRGPLLRLSVVETTPDEHVVLFNMHHIVCDGWSMGILLRELRALYDAALNGRPSPLSELPIQYADFAHWQRQWLSGEPLERELGYWLDQLAGELPVLQLPFEKAIAAGSRATGAGQSLELSAELSAGLESFSRIEGATLYMTLLAGFDLLLSRYCGEHDIVVGAPIANRNRAETEGLIGFFVNTLVLRSDLSGDPTFRELVGRVRRMTLDAYMHQDVPFEMLVEKLDPERDFESNPLFRVAFVIQNASTEKLELSGLEARTVGVGTGLVHFDLILMAAPTPEGLGLTFGYNAHRFEAESVRRMLTHMEMLLTDVMADPDQALSAYRLLDDTEAGGYSPDDFPDADLDRQDFEDLVMELGLSSEAD
ncbi:MAG: amino acid adenylation domain-containing protein [Acidobacteriota bacterium]